MCICCACSPLRKCIICEYPPCNCTKCRQLRCEGKPDREQIYSVDIEKDCANLYTSELNIGTENKTRSSDGDDIIFDIVGITAFVLMGTAIFWLAVCKYLWHYTAFVVRSGRKVKVLTLIVLLLIIACITYDGMMSRKRKLQTIEPVPLSSPPPLSDAQSTILANQEYPTTQHKCKCCKCKKCAAKCSKGSCETLLSSSSSYKSDTNLKNSPSFGDDDLNKETPSLCNLCSKQSLNSNISISNSTHTMSDDEIREMYSKFKLYFMPAEMKNPSLDNIIGFLAAIYNRITVIFRTTATT